MRHVCGHGNIGRRLSIEGIRDKISWVWNHTAYKAFLAMLTGLGHPEACFLSGIKAFFIKHRGYNDLRRATEGGNDAAAYLYAILLYRDSGGVAADDTAKGYMRRVASGGSTTSRWLSNEGCLPLREKATLVIHSLTWRIWGEPLPHLAQVRGDQPCAGTGGGCGVEKGWLRISQFCSEDCRLRCEIVKFAQSIGIGNQ
jgi:TPR repeat protein